MQKKSTFLFLLTLAFIPCSAYLDSLQTYNIPTDNDKITCTLKVLPQEEILRLLGDFNEALREASKNYLFLEVKIKNNLPHDIEIERSTYFETLSDFMLERNRFCSSLYDPLLEKPTNIRVMEIAVGVSIVTFCAGVLSAFLAKDPENNFNLSNETRNKLWKYCGIPGLLTLIPGILCEIPVLKWEETKKKIENKKHKLLHSTKRILDEKINWTNAGNGGLCIMIKDGCLIIKKGTIEKKIKSSPGLGFQIANGALSMLYAPIETKLSIPAESSFIDLLIIETKDYSQDILEKLPIKLNYSLTTENKNL